MSIEPIDDKHHANSAQGQQPVRDDTVLIDADPNALTIDAARVRISQHLPSIIESERVKTNDALGRVLAEDITAVIDSPPFRCSAMDGYALRHADGLALRQIVDESRAGHPSGDRLPVNGCCRVTTGARVPDDADTVIVQENTRHSGNTIAFEPLPPKGTHVRKPGSDIRKGDCIARAGALLRASTLGVLAANSLQYVRVRRQLSIALFSTGDELVEPYEQRGVGMIHDANRQLLASLLCSARVNITDLGIRRDTLKDLHAAYEAARSADVVLSSGGVSVGDADFVRDVLQSRGTLHLWKIAMKPGRPLSFGVLGKQCVWFGLPGNPVSAAITTVMLVAPAIAEMLGIPSQPLPRLTARSKDELIKLPGRVEYQRGLLQLEKGRWEVSTTGLQDSHVLTSLHEANCLVELPLTSTGAKPGEAVAVIPFSAFGEPRL